RAASSRGDSPMEQAKLQVRNLNFFYGKFHAIKKVSMDIPEKQVTAFIGPSGCGKSTLLRTFNRMFELYPEQRAEGEIVLGGNSLSGGQQQRLCIARGIAVRPEILLLDEPCSALDPISTAKIEELIAELKNDYTVVIVTHNMQQAARVSDYTAYMYLGELVEIDRTEQLFIKPPKKETEDYITGRFG